MYFEQTPTDIVTIIMWEKRVALTADMWTRMQIVLVFSLFTVCAFCSVPNTSKNEIRDRRKRTHNRSTYSKEYVVNFRKWRPLRATAILADILFCSSDTASIKSP